MTVFRSLLACMALVLLSACAPDDVGPPLPQGELTFSGVLLPAEISLVRRGTHVLQKDGTEFSFVESPSITLRNFEQKLVTLRGHMEANVDNTYLPVFVVDTVLDVADSSKEWSIRKFGLTFDTPLEWRRDDSATETLFYLAEGTPPIVSITQHDRPEEDPVGTSIIVDGKPAFRIINEATGHQLLYIMLEEHVLKLNFTPPAESGDSFRQDWLNVISSMRIRRLQDSPTQLPTGSGATGQPCGGPAGVLCPAGEYCDIIDTVEDIGICKAL